MIIDKSLLSNNITNESLDLFDIVDYSNKLLSEITVNTEILFLQEINSDTISNFVENIITGIINGIIKALKTILSSFISLLLKLLSMGKSFELEIRFFKDKIKNYNGEINFDNIYHFTNIYEKDFDQFPNKNVIKETIDDIISIIEKITKTIHTSKSFNELNYNLLDSNNQILQKPSIKNKLLGTNINDMSDELYSQKCFELFRNGQDKPTKITYTGNDVYEYIYLPYINQKKMIQSIKSDNNSVQKSIESAKNQIKSINIYNLSSYNDQEKQTLINIVQELQRNLCIYFEKSCKDIVVMYSAKLQAYKDCIVNAKSCLVKAIQEVNKIR